MREPLQYPAKATLTGLKPITVDCMQSPHRCLFEIWQTKRAMPLLVQTVPGTMPILLENRMGKLKALSLEQGYVASKFREHRDQYGSCQDKRRWRAFVV